MKTRPAEEQANAAIICQAVNNFEMLLLAVKGFQQYLKTDSRESKDLADIIAKADGIAHASQTGGKP